MIFKTLKQQNANEANTVVAINVLSRMLRTYYKTPVFIIMNGYDVPAAKALNTKHDCAHAQLHLQGRLKRQGCYFRGLPIHNQG